MFSKMLVSAVTATALLSTLPAFARDLKLADFHSPSHFIVEEVYEPFLIQEGFIMRTPRGREVTEKAYQHLGKVRMNVQGGLF